MKKKRQKFSTSRARSTSVERVERGANTTSFLFFFRSLFRTGTSLSSRASSAKSSNRWSLFLPQKREKKRKNESSIAFFPMDAEAQPRPRSGSAAAALLLRSGSGAPSSGGLLGRVLGTPLKMMAQVRREEEDEEKKGGRGICRFD